ncbi:NAD-dependent epimerase/dehydratase family protein [Candidatus Pacearchaeota archaeon]|nr:NAD-dependent epimerase/dehydratase family protein [Candidatus Pacearchaeota archaeon]
MGKNVLVTGGAGFIGSHLVKALVAEGHNVRVLDSLVEQVHGKNPSYEPPEGVEFIRGDVNSEGLHTCLRSINVVYHLAAEVGVGQSMYDIQRYIKGNTLATGSLLEKLINRKKINAPIEKLIVASSMSIYGEGAYKDILDEITYPSVRSEKQLKAKQWDFKARGRTLRSVPTFEDKPLNPTSVYATTKRSQEEDCLNIGRAYNIPTVALRFFNVYGPGQSLNNPYTGVMAIFASQLLNGKAPFIFEDGKQTRDFTHVSDIVQANLLAMKSERANYEAINVGTGRATSVLEVAQHLAHSLGINKNPEISGKYRSGDIRHCYAGILKAIQLLRYEPRVSFEDGLYSTASWIKGQHAVDRVGLATKELSDHGLIK